MSKSLEKKTVVYRPQSSTKILTHGNHCSQYFPLFKISLSKPFCERDKLSLSTKALILLLLEALPPFAHSRIVWFRLKLLFVVLVVPRSGFNSWEMSSQVNLGLHLATYHLSPEFANTLHTNWYAEGIIHWFIVFHLEDQYTIHS